MMQVGNDTGLVAKLQAFIAPTHASIQHLHRRQGAQVYMFAKVDMREAALPK